jgi:hypothetical protein
LTDVADSDVIAREADLIIRILKRRGKPLHEDEYEVEMDRLKASGPPKAKIRIKMRPDQFKAPRKALIPADDPPPRVGAEIALILGGNREGVLDAFTIHAIPGYNFSLMSANYSTEEIKKWVNEDDKEAVKVPGEKPQVPGQKKSLISEGMREAFMKSAPQRVNNRRR